MPDEPREQLASVAAVVSSMDKMLDELFANVAELKVILARAGTGEGKAAK